MSSGGSRSGADGKARVEGVRRGRGERRETTGYDRVPTRETDGVGEVVRDTNRRVEPDGGGPPTGIDDNPPLRRRETHRSCETPRYS